MEVGMDKYGPHYPLKEIQRQMEKLSGLNLTRSAKQGMHQLGMTASEVVKVVQDLRAEDFYKSMTTYQDHRVWQDVYHHIVVPNSGREELLYIKFQKLDEYFVISFKERSNG
jgi:motility quorum-sensing regulator / GCU-specific mRNA interferase toxin